jgi:hypothetical protein
MERIDALTMAIKEMTEAHAASREEEINALWRAVCTWYMIESARAGQPHLAGEMVVDGAMQMRAMVEDIIATIRAASAAAEARPS